MHWPQGPRRPCTVVIMGAVRFYSGTHPPTNLSIVINQPPGALTIVSFKEGGNSSPSQTYICQKASSAFRHVTLEVDICQSINAPPILPTYDTNYRLDYPAGLPRRLLTVDQAYLEAGIGMTINPTRSIINDTVLADTNWLPAELHDAMETYFSQYPSSVFFGTQQWHVWGMLASGVYQNPVFGPTLA